jgi:hypothetical protein
VLPVEELDDEAHGDPVLPDDSAADTDGAARAMEITHMDNADDPVLPDDAAAESGVHMQNGASGSVPGSGASKGDEGSHRKRAVVVMTGQSDSAL